MTGRDLLTAAKRGDEDAFGRLVTPYRRELYAHAYRMLGSASDAEDVLQDALLGAWRGLARFEGRSSLRSWLYTITTNASLKAIGRRPKRVLPIDYGPAADPHDPHGEPVVESVWIEPVPDERVLADAAEGPEARYERRESVELAFVAALQHLPARQRAVLILRDVLGFSAREVAAMLDTTPVSVDSALQRAHRSVERRLPEQRGQAAVRSLGDAELRATVDRYMRALESADVPAITAMLTDDATIAMPPLREWYAGRDAVARFFELRARLAPGRRRMLPTRANGQPAAAHYVWHDEARAFLPHAIHVLGMHGDRIREITVFNLPGAFAGFGLPGRVEPG